MDEWGLLGRIRRRIETGKRPGNLIADIGDDCAAFDLGNGRCGLITTDISVEGVHFSRDYSTPQMIGFKAMVANISDIAAMGGSPLLAFVSLGVPDYLDEAYVLSLYDGMNEACADLPLRICGGDLSSSGELVVNIAIYGEAKRESIILRKGAIPGDQIYVTGSLGDSEAGLRILTGGMSEASYQRLVQKHRMPPVRIHALQAIADEFSPTSMIDVSDGLLSDLVHICESSGTGFIIEAERIPISAELAGYAEECGIDPIDLALKSGEEYELIFTSRKGAAGSGRHLIQGIAVTPIGAITESGYRMQRNAVTADVPIEGYAHFQEEKDK